MPVLNQPQLRQPTMDLIGKINGVSAKGGTLPIADLIAIFPNAGLPPDVQAKLEARAINLNLATNGDGEFSSQGAKFDFKMQDYTIKVPENIGGTYTSTAANATLSFSNTDSFKRISGGMWFIFKDLERVVLTQSSILIDLEGDSYDTLINF